MVWSTDELREAFEVLGFMAPYVVVRSEYTGKKGRCSSNNLGAAVSPALDSVIPRRRSDLKLSSGVTLSCPMNSLFFSRRTGNRACKMCHKILQQRFQFSYRLTRYYQLL
jgi:hypothetical protein